MHLPGPAFDFLRFFTKRFELLTVDRSVFCHLSPRPAPPAPQSLSHNLHRHRSPSLRPARGCVSYFCVSCVMNINLYRSTCLSIVWPRLLLLASTAITLLYFYPPHHNLTSTGRRRWWARLPNAFASGQPPRAPSPPSPTSSPSFSTRLICCLCSFPSPCMHAPPPPCCLLRSLLTATKFAPSRHPHQT